jgi:hypothetical protein
MEPNIFSGTKAPANLADIEAIEQAYGFTLPEDYKAHILQHNGGTPTRRTFLQPVWNEPSRFVEREVNDFYSIKNGGDTLESALKSLRDQLHDDLVPFADETDGDQFVLSVGTKDYGAVYYISHEFYTPPEYDYDEEADTSTPPAPMDYGEGVYFLAPSFTAFLEGLVAGTPVT